ncbi:MULTISPECIES: PP2C family protein-serine/threonine phosphatase [unclassified Microcoleus]|uniref:PP2C family protein-serine/threonine phosphatase n=1 Tax=unclassified Microcoleus TaxID=2642155 RepID=UPI002FD64BB8
MYDLTRFTLRDMAECGLALRQFGLGVESMEEASNRIVRYLYENFCTKPTGEKSCALVRLFKTHPYEDLEVELAEYARSMLDHYPPLPGMKCMNLLATVGEQTEWNSRHTSVGHKAIPLASESVVAQMPMISQLIRQLGLDIKTVINPDPNLLVEIEQRKYNVFYVPEAIGSPYIPAQDSFVIPFGIKSVLGFGGLLPSGNMFAIIMFLKVQIPHSTAQMFSTLALNVKTALLPFYRGVVFAQKDESATASRQIFTRNTEQELAQLKSKVATLTQLLDVFDQSIFVQSDRLEQAIEQLADSAQKLDTLNERLKEDNLRMGAELDIVRQMQQMILPNAEELEIEGLDIAAYMEAADEVGGDYYDVLNTDGVVTLGIGDVTGHGLESGILMLMAQTAVRTLKEIPEVDPVRFLDALNRTLYKNVQRMKSEKSLTLAILNYSEGRVSISGQHEETIIVRLGGQVERIDTMDLGFPIALDDDIVKFISHISMELHPGDGIVLYTDGIPEAKDIKRKQYGVEAMCEVISQNWDLSAEEIKQAVIDDLRRHIGTQKVFDDITLLVLKRTQLGVEKKSHPQATGLL